MLFKFLYEPRALKHPLVDYYNSMFCDPETLANLSLLNYDYKLVGSDTYEVLV